MRQMFRRLSPFILIVVAVLIAAEPMLHHHPLQSSVDGTGSTACAICATGTVRLPAVAVHLSAPQTVAFTLVSPNLPIVSSYAPLRLSPRAPPAA